MAKEILLSAENLSQAFGRKKVLDGISLALPAGEITGLIGENGAGKTTLIKTLLGLLPGYKGSLFLASKPYFPAQSGENPLLAGVLEHTEMAARLSGAENLSLLASLDPAIGKERVKEVLALFGMEKEACRPFCSLSLGQKKRLALAAALLSKPRVLLLDEAENALDPAFLPEFRRILKELCEKEGCAILLSGHRIDEMALLANRILLLKNGRIIREKDLSPSAENLFRIRFLSPFSAPLPAGYQKNLISALPDEMLLRIAGDRIPALLEALLGAGGRICSVTQEKISPEELFSDTEDEKNA